MLAFILHVQLVTLVILIITFLELSVDKKEIPMNISIIFIQISFLFFKNISQWKFPKEQKRLSEEYHQDIHWNVFFVHAHVGSAVDSACGVRWMHMLVSLVSHEA